MCSTGSSRKTRIDGPGGKPSDARILRDTNNGGLSQQIDQLVQHTRLGAPIEISLIVRRAVPILDKNQRLAVSLLVNPQALAAVEGSGIGQNLSEKIQNRSASARTGFKVNAHHGHTKISYG